MRLRKYCVTVMDNWTPLREFWTLKGAMQWHDQFYGYAYLYKWIDGQWIEVPIGTPARS